MAHSTKSAGKYISWVCHMMKHNVGPKLISCETCIPFCFTLVVYYKSCCWREFHRSMIRSQKKRRLTSKRHLLFTILAEWPLVLLFVSSVNILSRLFTGHPLHILKTSTRSVVLQVIYTDEAWLPDSCKKLFFQSYQVPSKQLCMLTDTAWMVSDLQWTVDPSPGPHQQTPIIAHTLHTGISWILDRDA